MAAEVKRFGRRSIRSLHAVQWDGDPETIEVVRRFTGLDVDVVEMVGRDGGPAADALVLTTNEIDENGNAVPVIVPEGSWVANEDGTVGFLVLSDGELRTLYFERNPRAPNPDNDFVVIEQDESHVLGPDGEPTVGQWRWKVYDGANGEALYGSFDGYVDRSYVEACVESYVPGREVRVRPVVPGAPRGDALGLDVDQ